MKNSIFLIAIGLILLTGCSKEESFEPTEEQTIDTVYVLKQIDGTITMETISLDGQTGVDYTYKKDYPKEKGFTNGLYKSTSRDTNVITWSGFTDETGNYGNAELQMSTPSYSLHLMLVTECVRVEGNAAVYGGIITRVVQSSGNAPPFGENWRFYFKVVDNEHGNGLDYEQLADINYDQISNTRIFASPRSMSLCDIYLPGNRIWSSQGYQEVRKPGFVEVSENPEK